MYWTTPFWIFFFPKEEGPVPVPKAVVAEVGTVPRWQAPIEHHFRWWGSVGVFVHFEAKVEVKP